MYLVVFHHHHHHHYSFLSVSPEALCFNLFASFSRFLSIVPIFVPVPISVLIHSLESFVYTGT